jgi:hypothetical protein
VGQHHPQVRHSLHYGEEGILACRPFLAALLAGRETATAATPLDLFISIEVVDNCRCNDGFEAVLKLCQNFIKYEQALDDLARINIETTEQVVSSCPLTRDIAARSNRDVIEGGTNKSKHQNLAACSSVGELVARMNPDPNATYKLQLSESSSQQSGGGGIVTAEFVVGGITPDVDLVEAWIRSCVLFVHNSVRLQRPTSLKQGRPLAEQRELLFAHVIRDRFVEETLVQKKKEKARTTHPPADFSEESVVSFQLRMDDLDDDGGDQDSLSLPETVVVPTESPSTPFLSSQPPPPSLCPDESSSHWSFAIDSEFPHPIKKQRLEEKEAQTEILTRSSPGPTSASLDNFRPCSAAFSSDVTAAVVLPSLSTPTVSAVKGMLRSDAETKFTCNQLHRILRRLNASRRNQRKGMLILELQGYFDARSAELHDHFEGATTTPHGGREDAPGSGRILGIEILLDGHNHKNNGEEDADVGVGGDNDRDDEDRTNSNVMTVILRGGRKKLVRPRRSVCTPGTHLTSIFDLDLNDVTAICKQLRLCDDTNSVQPENAPALFDSYLDGLEARQCGVPKDRRSRFAIAHDLPCTI